MAFRFSLATVLRFRESVEKREELALQKILLEIARTKQRIAQRSAEIALAQEARNKALQHALPAFELQSLTGDVNAALERKKALVESLLPLERQRAAQTATYQAAHRDRQMLSDMAARQRDAYELERARSEQKALDDIFAARASRAG
jgi:flagellar export protein FliJ